MRSNTIHIVAGRAERHYWGDLWRFRELLAFLAWRDILVRYKQTVIGLLWAILRPVLTTVVFVFVFSKLAKMPSNGVPYPLLVFSAMLPWQFFASALSEASNSLIGNANLVSKIYFPRLIVPTSSVIVAFVDFLISCAILAVMMIYYQFTPTWHILLLPVFTFIAFIAAFGAGIWLAALNVEYRDFRYVIPFIVQFGLYVSPVGFSSIVVPEKWRLLYSLNPMVGVIEGFRFCVTGSKTAIYLPGFALSMGVVLAVAVSGIWYFRKTERAFADVI
ncbi:MAG: ABC transporter permease [Chthoniobacterales bacterium]